MKYNKNIDRKFFDISYTNSEIYCIMQRYNLITIFTVTNNYLKQLKKFLFGLINYSLLFLFIFIISFSLYACNNQKKSISKSKQTSIKLISEGNTKIQNNSNKITTITIGIEPCWSPIVTLKIFQPLATYLAKTTHYEVKLKIVNSVGAFEKIVKGCDFVLLQSYALYVLNHSFHSVKLLPLAIAVGSDGTPTEFGWIIVRADSNIRTIKDLKNKTFIFGTPLSTQKYFAAYITLKKNGIDPLKDLKHFDFGPTCRYNALAVYLGEFDAGVICQNYPTITKIFNFKDDLRIIAPTIKLPNWFFSASSQTPQKIKTCFTKAILSLSPKNRKSLHIFSYIKWKGFIKPNKQDLSIIKQLINKYHIPQGIIFRRGITRRQAVQTNSNSSRLYYREYSAKVK